MKQSINFLWILPTIMILAGCPNGNKETPSQAPPQQNTASPPTITNSYFNTNRPQKLAGVLLNEPSQVNEVAGFSNAVAFWTAELSQVTTFLKQNDGRMLPVLELRSFIFDPTTGVLRSDYSSIIKNLTQTVAASHSGPILFFIDEPLWNIRLSCHNKGLPLACAEVSARYANTLSQMKIVGQMLRQALPGSGLFHVEAFAELAIHQHQWGQLVMLDDAEYLGFDCYGSFNSCGGGTFAGITVNAQPMATYIEWVSQALTALENKNPIGRKILLVPGAFVNTAFFTSEQQVLSQLNSYLNALNTCSLCGGFAPFLWGNLQEANDTIVGARSLANVRPALMNALRSITQLPPASPPPSMTLVGGYQANSGAMITFLGTSTESLVGTPATAASLNIPAYLLPSPPPLMATLIVPSGTNGQIYVTEAGMDSCFITIGNGVTQPLLTNTLSMTLAPSIIIDTLVKATCSSSGKAYSQYFLFKVQ